MKPFEDLIGKPYRLNGRGPDFFDCAGLAIEMQSRRGCLLQIPETPADELGQVSAMRRILREAWSPIREAQPGCLVFFPGQQHVGTMVDARRFLHTDSDLGESCIEALNAPAWRRKKRLFYLPRAVSLRVPIPSRPEPIDIGRLPARLTFCENPFDLSRHHRRVPLRKGTVGAALKQSGFDTEHRRYVVSCNGDVLPPERGLAYKPRNGDDVQVVPQLENSTLRTIAMVGVAIAATAFAGPLGGLMASTLGVSAAAGSTAAAVFSSVAGSLISIGGGLLVNGIASLFQPGAGGQNYGVLGPSTTARSGIPIPKGYGRARAGFNIVESWIDIQGNNGDKHDVDDGADTIGRQYINVRCDAGWGPAGVIGNLLLNGKDINSFADVSYVLLYGTNDQQAVTADDPRWKILNQTTTGTTTNTEPTCAFDTINNNYPLNQRIRAGITTNYVVVPGQRSDTEKLTVYVVWPGGLWRLDDNQVEKRLACSYDVYYRVSGSGDAGWVHVAGNGTPNGETHYYYNIRTTVLRQATIIDNLPAGTYDVKVVNNGTGAVNNPIDHFEHESNKFGDQLWFESLQETSYTTLRYPNKIQVCLRLMATDQISGSDLSLQADIEYGLRSTLPAELAGLAEDNPAAVAYDICSDGNIGMNLPDSRIDLDFLAEMGALSNTQVDDGDGGTQNLARFNGIFDQPNVNCWEALKSVCFVGRAHPQRIGARITGWIDQPDTPVQLFHVGNILLNSYQKTWLSLEDRAQEVSINFADAADNYKQRNPCRVVASIDETSEEALKKTDVTMLGCTDRVQAYYRAVLLLHQNEDLLRKHKWQSNRNAIRCRTGNVVLLQQDIPTGALGGLVEPGSTAAVLRLDRVDIPFDTSSAYNIVVQLPAVKLYTCTVIAVGGGAVTFSGYDGAQPVNRMLFGGGTLDAGMSSLVAAAPYWSAAVDDTTGLSAGVTVELWITDPLETSSVAAAKQVVNPLTGYECTEVTLATPLPATPAEYCGYVYQSTARQAIKVRLSDITKRVNDQRYTLTAQDYSDATYDIPAPVSGQSYTPPAIVASTNAAGTTPAQGQVSVRYVTSGSGCQVTGLVVQIAGLGYSSSSTAQLQSDYEETQAQFNSLGAGKNVTTTDPVQTLTLAFDSSGALLSVTGYDPTTVWNEVPYVVLTK